MSGEKFSSSCCVMKRNDLIPIAPFAAKRKRLNAAVALYTPLNLTRVSQNKIMMKN